MPEELQPLIERIQREAIDASRAEADRIVGQAREKAAATVREAEAKSRALLEQAELESRRFAENAERTLEQAARDLLISVGQGVENILNDLVAETVCEALDLETVRGILVELAGAYARRNGSESRVEVLVSEEDQEKLIAHLSARYADHLAKGITIRAESGIHRGFRIELDNGAVSHDFTQEAIAESLSSFLRPHLAEIVHRAARNKNKAR